MASQEVQGILAASPGLCCPTCGVVSGATAETQACQQDVSGSDAGQSIDVSSKI